MNTKFQDVLRACKRSKAAYADGPTIKKQYKHSIFYDGCSKQQHDAQGFLYRDRNKIYVTFRGTMDVMDTRDVIDIRHEKLFSPHIKVHKGFHSQFFSIEEDITRDIKDIASSYKIEEIVFAGHSLGGSCALISSPYYAELFKNKYTIKTYTFGTVSVGNQNFVQWFQNNVSEHYRVENEEDVVPHIPVHNTFMHVPNGIILNHQGNIKRESQTCSSSYFTVLSKVLEKATWDQLYSDHSCEAYENNLLSSRKHHRDFWISL